MEQSSRPSDAPSGKPSGSSPKSWYAVALQLFIGLLLVWSWGQMFREMSTRTIPYSEFKEYVAKGEVVDCAIGSDQITGTIKLKDAELHKAESAAASSSP